MVMLRGCVAGGHVDDTVYCLTRAEVYREGDDRQP